MSQTGSHEDLPEFTETAWPRLIELAQEVPVFEGLEQPNSVSGSPVGFYREDQLAIPQLPGIALLVKWHNRYKIYTQAHELIDPFTGLPLDRRWATDQTFTAMLELTTEMFERAWLALKITLWEVQKQPNDTNRPRMSTQPYLPQCLAKKYDVKCARQLVFTLHLRT